MRGDRTRPVEALAVTIEIGLESSRKMIAPGQDGMSRRDRQGHRRWRDAHHLRFGPQAVRDRLDHGPRPIPDRARYSNRRLTIAPAPVTVHERPSTGNSHRSRSRASHSTTRLIEGSTIVKCSGSRE